MQRQGTFTIESENQKFKSLHTAHQNLLCDSV